MGTALTGNGDRVADDYPTRISGGAKRINRRDPTVWPGRAGPITSQDLLAHDRNGYHLIAGLLSDSEVQAFRSELDHLVADPRIRSDERTVVERRTEQVRSIFDVHTISAAVAELAADERVRGRAEQILGSDVYLHQSRINLMPGFVGKGFYWHSDFETWHAEDGMARARAVSMSIALAGNFGYNGGLMVMPGSHRTFVSCVGTTPEDNYKSSLKDQEIGVPDAANLTAMGAEYGIDQFTGSAGSALMFDCNLMHGSANNITPFPRSNIFLVFNSVDNALVEPFAAVTRRPEFIAAHTVTPLRS